MKYQNRIFNMEPVLGVLVPISLTSSTEIKKKILNDYNVASYKITNKYISIDSVNPINS